MQENGELTGSDLTDEQIAAVQENAEAAAGSATTASNAAAAAQTAQGNAEAAQAATEAAQTAAEKAAARAEEAAAIMSDNKDEIAKAIADKMLEPKIGNNKYNEANSSNFANGNTGTCKRGVAYLPLIDSGYDIYISTAGGSNASYIYYPDQEAGLGTSTIVVYDVDGETIADFSCQAQIVSVGNRSARKVTIPAGSNAAKIEFLYRVASGSGSALCREMMVTINYNPETYEPYQETLVIDGLNYTTPEDVAENYVSKKVYYVSTTGDDENDGLTKESPLATLQKALSLGATKIGIECGEYFFTAGLTISGMRDLHIFAYRTSESYEHSKPLRDKVRFVGAKYYDGYSKNTDGVYQQSGVTAGFDYNAVFVSKTKSPTVTDRTHHANLMVMHGDVSKDYYLKPVLTYDECKTTADSFYWDGSMLSFNAASTDFAKVAVIVTDYLFIVSNCDNVTFDDICFSLCKGNVLYIKDCRKFTLNNCEANASACYMGFCIENTDGTLNNCYTTKNAYDGYNYHGYGTTIMLDCVAENNYDDGCSHHDGCVGTINGGRFSGCGKAGIAPAYGANVNIYNVIASDNNIGIGYLTTNNGHARMRGIVSGCALVGNNTGLQVDSLASVTAVGCRYNGNTTDKKASGSLDEF